VRQSFAALDRYHLPSVLLRSLWTPVLENRVQAALAAAPADLRQFQFESIRFGQLAVLDLALSQKASDFGSLTPALRSIWSQYVESSVRSYLLLDACCRRFSVGRVVYFNDYSLMLGTRLAAKK